MSERNRKHWKPTSRVMERHAMVMNIQTSSTIPKAIKGLVLDEAIKSHQNGSKAGGTIELAYYRGIHVGYLQGFRDAKKGRKSTYQ